MDYTEQINQVKENLLVDVLCLLEVNLDWLISDRLTSINNTFNLVENNIVKNGERLKGRKIQ